MNWGVVELTLPAEYPDVGAFDRAFAALLPAIDPARQRKYVWSSSAPSVVRMIVPKSAALEDALVSLSCSSQWQPIGLMTGS